MNTPSDPDDIRWLVSTAAKPYLSAAQQDARPLHTQIQALRRDLSVARAHLVLEQVELRHRATAKFENADQLFYERKALEQSTDHLTAAYKAERFPAGLPVADLCTGMGGDLMALATRGAVVGIERNESLAILAETNGRIWQERHSGADVSLDTSATVQMQSIDVRECDLRQMAGWHIDPDRRPAGKRTTRVELHEPGPEVWQKLWEQNPNGAIKLAPGAEYPEVWEENFELEWISRDGSCRQLVIWSGELAQTVGLRRATVLTRQVRRTVQGMPDIVPQSSAVGSYLFEPDAAVLAADLVGVLAVEHDLQAIIPGGGYLTCEQPISDPALAGFVVEEVLPFQVKRLKSLLRERGIGRLEVKKRGVEQSPERLQKELKVSGDNAATLLLTRMDSGVTAILARRLNSR